MHSFAYDEQRDPLPGSKIREDAESLRELAAHYEPVFFGDDLRELFSMISVSPENIEANLADCEADERSEARVAGQFACERGAKSLHLFKLSGERWLLTARVKVGVSDYEFLVADIGPGASGELLDLIRFINDRRAANRRQRQLQAVAAAGAVIASQLALRLAAGARRKRSPYSTRLSRGA